MNVIRGVEFWRLVPRLLCGGLLAMVMVGCADDAARLMYRSQSELTRHRRMEAESAARQREMERAADRLQAELDEGEVLAGGEVPAEGEAQERTLEELQAAVTGCLRGGGTYEVCYGDQSAYLTCLAAGGRDAECRPNR